MRAAEGESIHLSIMTCCLLDNASTNTMESCEHSTSRRVGRGSLYSHMVFVRIHACRCGRPKAGARGKSTHRVGAGNDTTQRQRLRRMISFKVRVMVPLVTHSGVMTMTKVLCQHLTPLQQSWASMMPSIGCGECRILHRVHKKLTSALSHSHNSASVTLTAMFFYPQSQSVALLSLPIIILDPNLCITFVVLSPSPLKVNHSHEDLHRPTARG